MHSHVMTAGDMTDAARLTQTQSHGSNTRKHACMPHKSYLHHLFNLVDYAPELAQRLLPIPQLHLQDVLKRGARLPAHMCMNASLLSRGMHLRRGQALLLPVCNGTNQQLPIIEPRSPC